MELRRSGGYGWVGAVALAAAFGCGEDDAEGLCDPGALVAALARAMPGDVVRLGDCTVPGSFVVPAGAALEGVSDASTIEGDESTPVVLRLTPGTEGTATRLRRVRVRTRGSLAAVRARGPGAVRLEDVEVEAKSGVGVALSELDEASLVGVTVTGDVPDDRELVRDPLFTLVAPAVPADLAPGTAEQCAGVTPLCDPATRIERSCTDGRTCGPFRGYCDPCGRPVTVLATVGLFVDRVGRTVVEGTDVRGLGLVGAFFYGEAGGEATWTTGDVGAGLGLGVYTSDVDLELVDVAVVGMHQGFRAEQAIGLGFVSGLGSGAGLRTEGLVARGNEGYGAIQRGGIAAHADVDAGSNTRAALWVGEATGFAIDGGRITDNDLAGIVVVESSDVALANVSVEGVRLRTTTVGAEGTTGTVAMGDGLHLVRTRDRVALTDVTLRGNARAGLLLEVALATGIDTDICASGAGVCFDRVAVDASGTAAGALAVSSPLADEVPVFSGAPIGTGVWDRGIVRSGVATGDGGVTAALDAVGVIAPLDFPRPEGLAGVIAPLD